MKQRINLLLITATKMLIAYSSGNDIFDDNYTVFQLGKMCGCAFSHIAFTIKTGHIILPPFLL